MTADSDKLNLSVFSGNRKRNMVVLGINLVSFCLISLLVGLYFKLHLKWWGALVLIVIFAIADSGLDELRACICSKFPGDGPPVVQTLGLNT